MNNEDDTPLHELSGLFALDALEELDRSRFEKHLATCAACQSEVAEFRETMAQVATMNLGSGSKLADEADLPPALRTSVLSQIDTVAQSTHGQSTHGESDASVSSPFSRPVAAPSYASTGSRSAKPTGAARFYVALAAAAAIVAVVIGFAAIRDDDSANEYAVLAELRAHGATSVPMVGNTTASIELVREADGSRAIVVATDLAKVSPDLAYQAWIIRGSEVRPASMFIPHDDGRAIVVLDYVPDDVETIAVTIEPKGGSQTPTSAVVFSAKVA